MPPCLPPLLMVEAPALAVERQTITDHIETGASLLGWGAVYSRGNQYRVAAVGRGASKPPGTLRCGSGSTDVLKGQDSIPCSSTDGQPDSSVLHNGVGVELPIPTLHQTHTRQQQMHSGFDRLTSGGLPLGKCLQKIGWC